MSKPTKEDKELEQVQALPRDIERVVESGPDGGIVEHLRYNRTRMIDGLYGDRWLTEDQFTIANKLRRAFDACRLVADVGAQDMEAAVDRSPPGSPLSDDDEDEDRELYDRLMARLAREERQIVVAVVLHDGHPNDYGARRKCDGLAFLRRCLDKLVKYYA